MPKSKEDSFKTPFQLLNLNQTASKEEIKNSFRKLIRQYHPDMHKGDRNKAEEIIEAYHKALHSLNEQEKNINKEQEEFFQFKFFHYYQIKFWQPNNKAAWITHIRNLALSLRAILYAKGEIDFFEEYINILIKQTSKHNPKEPWLKIIAALLDNYLYLLTFRREIHNLPNTEDEYKLEKIRIEIMKYISTAMNAKDYFSYRNALFAGRDNLISDCIRAINSTTSRIHRQEIFPSLH